MPDYRLYALDADGKILKESMTVDCVDDGAAREAAALQILGEHVSVEIWNRRRFVGRVP